jgi:hypothetical protein
MPYCGCRVDLGIVANAATPTPFAGRLRLAFTIFMTITAVEDRITTPTGADD